MPRGGNHKRPEMAEPRWYRGISVGGVTELRRRTFPDEQGSCGIVFAFAYVISGRVL